METPTIPSSADVRRLLAAIPLPRMRELAKATGVPFGTLYKISTGETTNPGIETTRRFYASARALAGTVCDASAAAAPSPQHQEPRHAA